jgi:cell division protein FtsN
LEKTLMYKLVLTLSLAALLSVSGCSRQQSDWEKTRASNTTDAYESFLKRYPSGEFTAQAQARLKELYEERDWQKARDIDSADAYQAFLKQYPEGKWSEEARIRIENFTLAAAPSNGTSASPAASPPSDAAPPAATGAAPAAQDASPKPSHKAAQTPPAKAAVAGPAQGGGNRLAGTFGVQLGAFKTGEEAANKRWANLSGKYPKLLSGLSPLVSSRKVATGTMYRLQVVNLSGERARAICKDLKAHSQACDVLLPAH